ncbi:hypothetical protein JZ751_026870 [Albula glossodonta]|uniref:Inositol 1,4,5-trisphosphate receptor-interacting protein n=1 Tax=Albula glossodonta TaxID=121402 RepID=A0A8T2PD70_9TELE|nr:hypothetical protein JZ751_026870 [Albula glossodonta]
MGMQDGDQVFRVLAIWFHKEQPLTMQAASLVTVVAAIFHHLTKVGYEIVTPMSVQQDEPWAEGDRMWLCPKDQMLPLLGWNLSPVDQEICPVSENFSPEDQEQCHQDQDTQDTAQEDSWYLVIGNVFAWFTVNFLWKKLQKSMSHDLNHKEEEDVFAFGLVTTEAPLLDKGVLGSFYERCIHTAAHEYWRVLEFVEGFSDDLLEALRGICDREADIEVGDCIGVGSVYEFWRVTKPLSCDLFVPFTPPEPYRYGFQLWCSPVNGINGLDHVNGQGWGKIKVETASDSKKECCCGAINLGEDILCLLHGPNDMPKVSDAFKDLLCSKNSSYLSKNRVIKWFQIAITKAWGQISHKYEFELTFRNLDSPGALKVRFRSGKTIIFNITPVIQFQDSDAYFVSHFALNRDNSSDTYWPLSFAVYEKHLLKSLTKGMEENSCHICCLQIVSFLNKKQTVLTGRSFLSNYHLKTTLLHLLLVKKPLDWSPDYLEQRVCDILEFIKKSLQKKQLCHVLTGNDQVPKDLGIPAILLTAKPINLFHPLVLQRQLYNETVKHFQEMCRNAPVLIQEYSPRPHFNVLGRLNTRLHI